MTKLKRCISRNVTKVCGLKKALLTAILALSLFLVGCAFYSSKLEEYVSQRRRKLNDIHIQPHIQFDRIPINGKMKTEMGRGVSISPTGSMYLSNSKENNDTVERTKQYDIGGRNENNSVGIVNPLLFSYVINEEKLCSNQNLGMIVYVYTALQNYEFRWAIRRTWANPAVASRLNYTVVFVMGRTNNVETMARIKKESASHHDIIQENYMDSYRNLSLKGLSAIKWIVKYCPSVPLVLKIDDDVILNVYVIRQYLNEFGYIYTGKKIIFGLVNTGMRVERNKTSKLYVPDELFTIGRFPAYCAGAAYLMTSRAVKAIYEASFGEIYLHIEDVFITGILGKKAGASRGQIHGRYEFRDNYMLAICTIHNRMPEDVWFTMVKQPQALLDLWAYIKPPDNGTSSSKVSHVTRGH